MTIQTRPIPTSSNLPLALAPRWIALGLALIVLLTRIPLRARFLYHWDSVNYALAMEKFNILAHHPHPPGYVLYVALGQLALLITADANAAFVWVSVIASAIAAPLIYLLARDMYGARVGLWAGLFLLTSPLFWFYGEVALPYTPDIAIALGIALACYRTIRGQKNAMWVAAALMGLVGGVRPQTTVILFPLWVYAVYKQGWVRVLLGLVVMGLGALVWLVPLALLHGGPARYFSILASYSANLGSYSPLQSLESFGSNLVRVVAYLLYGLTLGLPVLLYVGLRRISEWQRWISDERVRVLLLWLIPALGFYTLVHLQQPGHLMIVMPPLIILLAQTVASQRARVERMLGGAIIVTGVLFFLMAPARLMSLPESVLITPTWQALHTRDTFLAESIETMRREFDPQTTALLGVSQAYHQPEFYLREYRSFTEQAAGAKKRIFVPRRFRKLVLFGDPNEGDWQPAANLQFVPMEHSRLYYLEAQDGEQIYIDRQGVGVVRVP